MPNDNPTVRRQEVGEELRVLRKAEGFTLEQAGRVINSSASKLSRIEAGFRRVTPVEVSALVAVYKATPSKRDELLALAEDTEQLGWWQHNRTRYEQQKRTLINLESRAECIVNFDVTLIPGLMQTGEYAQAVLSQRGYVPEGDIKEGLETRLRRQAVLWRRNPPHLLAVVDELALHRLVGGREIMRRQLEHLVHQSRRHHVSLRVLPNDGQLHSGLDGSFILVRRPGISPVVLVETLTASLFVEEQDEVRTYELTLKELVNRALAEEESVSLIASLAQQLNTEATGGTDRVIDPDLAQE